MISDSLDPDKYTRAFPFAQITKLCAMRERLGRILRCTKVSYTLLRLWIFYARPAQSDIRACSLGLLGAESEADSVFKESADNS